MCVRFFYAMCAAAAAAMVALVASSCADKAGGERASDYNQTLLVSEVMTDNLTTLANAEGKTPDWIEITNLTDSKVSLDGYSLMLGSAEMPDKADAADKSAKAAESKDAKAAESKDAKAEESKGSAADESDGAKAAKGSAKASGKKSKKDKDGGNSQRWTFPDVDLEPGASIVVFMGQKSDATDAESKAAQPATELRADIKLPSDGGCVMLLNPHGCVASDIRYGKLATDEALCQDAQGVSVRTFAATPGFANTDEGYVAFMVQRDEACSDGLKLWEVKPTGAAKSEQWVELRNTSSADIHLADYCLTNKRSKPSRWQLPDVTLAPGQFFTVMTVGRRAANASGKGGKGKPNAANFKLSSNGGVALTKGGRFVDGMSGRSCPHGTSRGRIEGQQGLFYFSTPTQGKANTEQGYRHVAPQPQVSRSGGMVEGTDVTVSIDGHGQQVRYTTDGTLPTASSPLYSKDLHFTASTTLRYYAVGDADHMASDPLASTYLIGEHTTLPVLHITMRPDDLFDPHHGIYVEGSNPKRMVTQKMGENEVEINYGANYLQHWTKEAYAEFFDTDGKGFGVACGLKLFGAGSRRQDKKSFCLKFDAAYGPESVTYDFFGTGEAMELEDIVVRSGTNGVMVRDEFFTSLMAPESPTILTQAYRPIVLYINHEYWGLYYLREKIGRDFVARHLGTSNDSISILCSSHAEEGSAAEYTAIHSYVRSANMASAEAYDWMDQHVSLTSLIDYKLGQIYSGNTDIYNVREVRSAAKDGDQKWHYVLYDLDESFVTKRPVAFYLRAGYSNGIGTQPVAFNNQLIDRLLQNDKFRQLFLERLSHHVHHTFSPEHVSKAFDHIIGLIEPEMERNCKRWPTGTSYAGWQYDVKHFREKLPGRVDVIVADIKQELRVTEEEAKRYGL